MIARLPDFATGKINDATQLALRKCLNIALRTLGKPQAPDAEPEKPSNLLHKLAVATTGAAGGAFGFLALTVELPVTTTLIFRSVCDIARSEGEDLTSVDTQLQCLAVLGMGGNPDKQEEDADLGYFVLRGALAQAISN
ncbi:EcsC family protein, partial [Staphylococcus capitis]|nr:EcsC family protein [Staphylococcus capitis]